MSKRFSLLPTKKSTASTGRLPGALRQEQSDKVIEQLCQYCGLHLSVTMKARRGSETKRNSITEMMIKKYQAVEGALLQRTSLNAAQIAKYRRSKNLLDATQQASGKILAKALEIYSGIMKKKTDSSDDTMTDTAGTDHSGSGSNIDKHSAGRVSSIAALFQKENTTTSSSDSSPSPTPKHLKRSNSIKISLPPTISVPAGLSPRSSPVTSPRTPLSPTSTSLELIPASSAQELLYHFVATGNETGFKMLFSAQSKRHPAEKLATLYADSNGITLMHKAAKYDQVEIMDFLYSCGIPIDVKDNLDSTPLMYAASNGSHKACFFLLSKGAEVNIRDKYEQTPLLLAMSHEYYEIVESLLFFGCDMNFKGSRGWTALHAACHEGNFEKVKYLISKGASVHRTNRKSETCLFQAIQHPDLMIHMLELVLQQEGPSKLVKLITATDDSRQTIIHHCAISGHLKSFAIILHFLSKLDSEKVSWILNVQEGIHGATPLHLAVQSNQFDIAKFLTFCKCVNIDATTNTNGNTPLHVACALRNLKMIELLVFYGASNYKLKNKNGKTAKQLGKDLNIEVKLFLRMNKLQEGMNDSFDVVFQSLQDNSSLRPLSSSFPTPVSSTSSPKAGLQRTTSFKEHVNHFFNKLM